MAFKKNIVVGVSVNPEVGLEVVQVDFLTRTVQKYGVSSEVKFDKVRKQLADLDIFKDSLKDLLVELQIPKGAEVVLNLPTVMFKVSDYPRSLTENEIMLAIEEDLAQHPIFQNTEGAIGVAELPNATMQFRKIAYSVLQKDQLIEIAMMIKDLGLKLIAIDTSVNSTLNALLYNERIDLSPDVSWVMLLIESDFCRVLLMQGSSYVDCYEERISIGEVLDDEDNYGAIISAVSPLLNNIPSQRLLVLSKTNVISAEVLSEKLSYKSQIIHQEANRFANAPFLTSGSYVDEEMATKISIDAIGAAIYRDFLPYTNAPINLFNASLGEIYTSTQPPELRFGSLRYVMSLENMIGLSIIVALIIAGISAVPYFQKTAAISENEAKLKTLKASIAEKESFIRKNSQVSVEKFNEADEIRIGLEHNKRAYSYYTIVGTEIPKKLWLTALSLGKNTTIEGQADNLESVYSFFRNVKDYDPNSRVRLQKLSLATSSNLQALSEDELFDTDSILTSMNADYYEFRITDAPDSAFEPKKAQKKGKGKKSPAQGLTDLEPLE